LLFFTSIEYGKGQDSVVLHTVQTQIKKTVHTPKSSQLTCS